MPRTCADQALTLRCRGCGSELVLDRAAPLLPGVRPFVEVHRPCGCGDDQDLEMRSAFARSA